MREFYKTITDVIVAPAHRRSQRFHLETDGTPTVDAPGGGGSTPSLPPGGSGRRSPARYSASFATTTG